MKVEKITHSIITKKLLLEGVWNLVLFKCLILTQFMTSFTFNFQRLKITTQGRFAQHKYHAFARSVSQFNFSGKFAYILILIHQREIMVNMYGVNSCIYFIVLTFFAQLSTSCVYTIPTTFSKSERSSQSATWGEPRASTLESGYSTQASSQFLHFDSHQF